jgi:hypothetical protein
MLFELNRDTHLHESHRTLRDGSFGVATFPGTSCQTTIVPSLRDISQQALARRCCKRSASASRRDNTDRSLARSAWEKRPPKNPSRRVRYDRAKLITRVRPKAYSNIRNQGPTHFFVLKTGDAVPSYGTFAASFARPKFQSRCPERLPRFVVEERPLFQPDNLTARKSDPVQAVQP